MPNTQPNRNQRRDNSDEPQSRLDREMVRWTRAVAIFTFCLVVASAISDWFIYQQWSVASKTQIDTREQLRALVTFVGGDQVTLNDNAGAITHYSFVPTFRNFGATRTATFSAWSSIAYFAGAVPNNADFSKPQKKIDIANTIIGPNTTLSLQPISVTSDEVMKAFRKEGSLVLWGGAQWSDIFEPKVIHPIKFCVLLTPNKMVNTEKIFLVATPYQNECNGSE